MKRLFTVLTLVVLLVSCGQKKETAVAELAEVANAS